MMPNWIEGTLKLRGKPEHIKRFFREGLEPQGSGHGMPDQESFTEEEIIYGDSFFTFHRSPHVVGTRRAFITDEDLVWVYGETDTVVAVSVQQAWGFIAENWAEIAKKYNLDIRLQGFESGMQFAQDLIVKADGTVEKDKEIHYDDWDWECPFPKMGG